MNYPNVVAFAAAAAQSGKSTSADVLVNEYGYTRLRFAGVLKAMVREFLRPLFLGDEDILASYTDGLNKDRMIPELGLTARDLMITLGTDWGRTKVHQDIWVKLLAASIEKTVELGGRVVIDDLRFPNELKAVRQAGGKVFFLYRPQVTPLVTPLGRAEGLIKHYECDASFENSGTIEGLQWWVRMMVEGKSSELMPGLIP